MTDYLQFLILKIYNDTRAGMNTEQGLQDSRNSMINELVGNLRRRPEWLAQRYLELHPVKPPEQIIDIDIVIKKRLLLRSLLKIKVML